MGLASHVLEWHSLPSSADDTVEGRIAGHRRLTDSLTRLLDRRLTPATVGEGLASPAGKLHFSSLFVSGVAAIETKKPDSQR